MRKVGKNLPEISFPPNVDKARPVLKFRRRTGNGIFSDMNICYCYDSNFEQLTLQSIESVLRFNPDAKIFTIRKDDFGYLSQFTDELVAYKHITRACFLRLLIPLMFPHQERMLYLDGDTVCRGSLRELYETPFDGKWIVACRGHDASLRQAAELGLPWYVNSGVLLMNIPAMLDGHYFKLIERTWKASIGKPRSYSADETIINWCLHEHIKLAPERFNYCHNRRYRGREVKPEDVVVWHVTGPNKAALYELQRYSPAIR